MALVAKFEDSSGTLRLDLNSATGFALEGIDLGDHDEEQTWLTQTPHAGGILASTRTEIAVITMTILLLPQASVAAMTALMSSLHVELERETNIFRFQPDGGSAVLYNTYKSPSRPSLFRGQGGIVPGASRLYDPEPIQLVIPRDPIPRSGSHI